LRKMPFLSRRRFPWPGSGAFLLHAPPLCRTPPSIQCLRRTGSPWTSTPSKILASVFAVARSQKVQGIL